MTDEALFHWLCTVSWTDEKWWDIVGRSLGKWVQADSKTQAKRGNQQPRNKSKKGGVQKRVYCWGCISVHGKSVLIVWTAKAAKEVLWRHTKNIHVGTVFEEDGVVWRVVESKSMQNGVEVVSYCDHFDNLDANPPIDDTHYSRYSEVKKWHLESRDRLAGLCVTFECIVTLCIVYMFDHTMRLICVCVYYVARLDLEIPNGMQDTKKTIEIYR